MANNEEKLLILKMIEEGKVSSSEGLELLTAVDNTSNAISAPNNNKWIKIRISEKEKTKVNVNIPISLVDIGLKIASKMSPESADELNSINFTEIAEMIKSGAEGKIVDIYDEAEDTTVEVYVE